MRAVSAFALCALLSGAALAATRARYGGELQLGVSSPETTRDPALSDTPADAPWVGLAGRPLCRVTAEGALVPATASELRGSASSVRVTLPEAGRLGTGAALGVRELFASWARLSARDAPSPYRALLFPLRGEGRSFAGMAKGRDVAELPLAFAFPDFAESLCHPALAPAAATSGGWSGAGPFVPRPDGRWEAQPYFAAGRPYADAVQLSRGEDRKLSRALAAGQLDAWLGGVGTEPGLPAPARFATYLAFQPDRVGPGFRAAFDAAIDRGDLVRYFVPAPAEPMGALLPSAYGAIDAGTSAAVPARAGVPGELTLAFDASLEDQRAVAERIQVKLHDRGYQVLLAPLPRVALRARWASGEYDLLLTQVLLPSPPAAALAVALELARRHDLLAGELPPLGAIVDPSARAAQVRLRAAALGPGLPLIPLYARAPRTVVGGELRGLTLDALGLPQLEDAFVDRE